MESLHNTVRIHVTPELEIPKERLTTELLSEKFQRKWIALYKEDSYMPEAKDMVVLKEGHRNGFVNAVCHAFQNHYPISLRP